MISKNPTNFSRSVKEKSLMKIKDIKINEHLYPRFHWSWHTSYAYSQMMKANAKFPPIVVAYLDRKYFLVDGRHRLEAMKMNDEKYISVEVLKGLTKKEIFVESIKRNATHGRALSAADKAKIIVRLKYLKYPAKEISELVRVPLKDLKTFVSKRVTNVITGEEVVLKSSLRHLAKEGSPEYTETEIDEIQGNISGGKTQVAVLSELRLLLESDLIDKENKIVIRQLKVVHKLIDQLLGSVKLKKNEI